MLRGGGKRREVCERGKEGANVWWISNVGEGWECGGGKGKRRRDVFVG